VEGSSFGWWSIIPPLLTIVLAISTRRVVPALLLGIVAGTLILNFVPKTTPQTEPTNTSVASAADSGTTLPTAPPTTPAPSTETVIPATTTSTETKAAEPTLPTTTTEKATAWLVDLFENHLWYNLADGDHLRVLAFTILLGMQIALIHACGGMEAIVSWLAPLARGRRSGQVLTYVLGLIIFIDDYANTLLLGSTMRPVTDRLRISREKLSFIVDSTAAPVSGLALVSTWVATEISAISSGFEQVGQDIGGQSFSIFVETIPSRFYVIFMLIFVFLVAIMNRDFGSMLTAERKALIDPPGKPKNTSDYIEAKKGNVWYAFLPIGITVFMVFTLLIQTGLAGSDPAELNSLDGWRYWATLFGNGNSYIALLYGSLAGLITIILMSQAGRLLNVSELEKSLISGFLHVLPALVILWLAWTLSRLAGKDFLGTGSYLADMIKGNIPLALMPTITFVLACGIAFSTGTSWGTMSLVIPLTIQTLWEMLNNLEPAARIHDPIMIACIGSVLAGAIFGDHCSPISDTTVLSARASDCDLIAHTRTQMPYALTVAGISILCGTLPIGFGAPAWLLLILGTVAMIAVVLLVGQKVETQTEN
jgi:Na+/H+ antiporter NhaC